MAIHTWGSRIDRKYINDPAKQALRIIIIEENLLFFSLYAMPNIIFHFSQYGSVNGSCAIEGKQSFRKQYPKLAKLHTLLFLAGDETFSLKPWLLRLYPGRVLQLLEMICNYHCVKSVQIRSFSWSVFCCIRTRKNYVFGHFLCCLPTIESQKRNWKCIRDSKSSLENIQPSYRCVSSKYRVVCNGLFVFTQLFLPNQKFFGHTSVYLFILVKLGIN